MAASSSPHTYRIEQARLCRICGCSDESKPEIGKGIPEWRREEFTCCFELVPIFRNGPQVVRQVCSFVAPDLCSFCQADGGPKAVQKLGPDDFGPFVDRFGEPLPLARKLPQ